MLQFVCFAGFFLQILLRIGLSKLWDRKVLLRIGGTLLVSIVIVGLGLGETDTLGAPAYEILAWMCYGFAIFSSWLLRDYLLRTIGPTLFVFWSMLFCYVVVDYRVHFFLIFGFLCLALGLASCFTASDRITSIKLLLYIMYISLVCGVVWFGSQDIAPTFRAIFSDHASDTVNTITAFSFGMALSVIGLNLAFLYTLIPNRGNGIDDIKETIRIYVTNYREDVSKQHIYILLVIAGLLTTNYYYDLLNDGLLISLVITSSQLLSHRATSSQRNT